MMFFSVETLNAIAAGTCTHNHSTVLNADYYYYNLYVYFYCTAILI